jgi:hypothetical protein
MDRISDLSGELKHEVSPNAILITPVTNGLKKYEFHIVATVNDKEF